MDFLNPKKKRAQRRRLIIGYFLIGVAIALVTLILVFQTYGFDVDRKTGSIIQNGLLFVAAQPEPADIYLNGKQYKTQNDARLVLPSDVYRVELKRSGYRDWSRTISLAGGSIERLVYPFMFPVNLELKIQKSYAFAPNFATESPDRHWILVQQPGQLNLFDQFDANDVKAKPAVLDFPATLMTPGNNSKLTMVEWSTDNRHVLVRHAFDGGDEFIMLDRDTPASSYNVNKVFKLSPTEVSLRDKNFDQLYLYDGVSHTLSRGTSKDGVVTPELSNVLAYKSFGSDLLLYATDAGATAGKARIMYKDGDGSFFLQEVSLSPQYLLDLAQYNNHWYFAAGGQADNKVYIYEDPQPFIKKQSNKVLYPLVVMRLTAPNWMEFSANTQFITVENGSHFVTFDAEHHTTFTFDTKTPLDPAGPHATWMDGNRLLLTSDNKSLVVDFDGTNLQTLNANLPGMPPFFDRDYKEMYNVAPSNGIYALTRVNLNLSNKQ